MFCPRSRKGVPKLFTPNRQTRFVLQFVLDAGYCNSNSSVRPRERWVVGAYATWPKPERASGLQATLLMLVLHLLVQCTCRVFAITWCCRKTRSNRKWHHGVSSLRSMRQQFKVWSRAAELCGTDPWPPSRRVVHAYVFFFTLPELHPFCLALAGSTSGRSCGDHKDYLWCYEVVGEKRPLQTSGRCRANKCELCKEKFRSFWHRRQLASYTPLLFQMCAEMCPCRQREVPQRSTSRKRKMHSQWLRKLCSVEKHFSPYCEASLHLQAAGWTLCGACVFRFQVGNIRLFSSCVVHWRPCVPEDSGSPQKLKRTCEWERMCFGVVGQRGVGKTEDTTTLFFWGDSGGVAAFSYVTRTARRAVEAAEFTCRILRLVWWRYALDRSPPSNTCPSSLCCKMQTVCVVCRCSLALWPSLAFWLLRESHASLVLERENEHGCSDIKEQYIHTEHRDLSSRSPLVWRFTARIPLVCTHGFGHIPDAKMSFTRCCSSTRRRLLSAITHLIRARLRILPWNSGRWKVDHQWCQQSALHGKLRVHELREHQELLSFALLASEKTKWSVIDTMLFNTDKESRLLSAITRFISTGSGTSVGIMPWSQSSREHWVQRFCFRGKSRSHHWG